MLKNNLFLKKIRESQYTVAIISSCAWIVGISWLYFDYVLHYPNGKYSLLVEKIVESIFGRLSFHNLFEWVDVGELIDNEWYYIAPAFKLFGYIKLTILPVLIINFLVFWIWPNYKMNFILGIEKFKSLNVLVQIYLLFATCFSSYMYLLYGFETLMFFVGLFVIPFIIQYCLYMVVYTITKAIKDAQK